MTSHVPAARLDSDFPFAPDSAVRRVQAEGILLLGGGRALLMQIAHPSVARGVDEHSNYATDRLSRLLGTLRPMYAITFGNRGQALAAARSVNLQHQSVRGETYNARDPQLLAWVMATLIDTSLFMHDRLVGTLPRGVRQNFYKEMREVGGLLGMPRSALPPDFEDFRRYMGTTLTSLEVTDTARAIARRLFTSGALTWPVIAPARLLTAGWLPYPLREQFLLSWGKNHERALKVFEAGARLLVPRVPQRLRRPPWFLMPQP